MFAIDCPGGSGKTYLYNVLSSFCESRGFKLSMSAWTGVATTLLRKGKTVHSTFKLPLYANSDSSSWMKRQEDILLRGKVIVFGGDFRQTFAAKKQK